MYWLGAYQDTVCTDWVPTSILSASPKNRVCTDWVPISIVSASPKDIVWFGDSILSAGIICMTV